MLNKQYEKLIIKSTGAKKIIDIDPIQNLWGGYGEILKCSLEGGKINSVIVKDVNFPKNISDNDISHNRKLKSYKVETEWYSKWSKKFNDNCYIPKCFAIDKKSDEVLIVMEDLDSSGFSERKRMINWEEVQVCIKWLANFHVIFMNETPKKLWKNGTYWHLDTRPDELKALKDEKLKKAAPIIDQKLKKAKYKTIVHGDAKLENFCFSKDSKKVAVVDFQYVGGGCGMKDLAYFTGSCFYEDELEFVENDILDFYFSHLKTALSASRKETNFDELEKEWRELYRFAWADFHRFFKGWSLEKWDKNSYSEKVTKEVIEKL